MLLVGLAIGIIIKSKKKEQDQSESVPGYLLTPDEKSIIQVLGDNKGTMHQKQMGKDLNWSKSKVSAVISALEHKKIVSKEKLGRSYKVTLEKKVQ